MKRLMLLALLWPSAAVAQPPKEIAASDTIEFQVGQTRTLEYDQPVARLILADDEIAKVMPESDRTFTLKALKSGNVLMTAIAPDGRVIHRSNVEVGGHLVKVYGQKKPGQNDVVSGGAVIKADRSNPDYVGYICTSTGCGRANPDVPATPFSTTNTETKDSGAVSLSREYR
jgi:hypothetical protein